MRLHTLLIFIYWATSVVALASTPGEDTRLTNQVKSTRIQGELTLDGHLTEKAWQYADVATNFANHWPLDTGLAVAKTEIRILYDDNFLYIGATMYDNGDQPIIQTLRRDGGSGHWGSDGIGIVLDPINQRSNGFFFAVNAGGAQMESSIAATGGQSLDHSWDCKWYSEISRSGNSWFVEMAIPFNSLRYNDRLDWGINFVRNDMERNEYHTWTEFPNNFGGVDLGFTGQLNWSEAPPVAKSNVVLIPYASSSVAADYEEGNSTDFTPGVGLDAKIAVTPSLNLDLTINPDFSQVEVDQQVTNLSRFSLFFPERRAFFLENSDLFANLGIGSVRPFFSRRIGLDGEGGSVPILFGARLSGNLNDRWRIGLMNVQTGGNQDQTSQNYSVGVVQRQLFGRSTATAFMVNRQAFTDNEFQGDDFNRVGGLEMSFISMDGRWRANGRLHHSFTPDQNPRSFFYNVGLEFNEKNWAGGAFMHHLDPYYTAEVGFTPRVFNYDVTTDSTYRLGYTTLFNFLRWRHFPLEGIFNNYGFVARNRLIYNEDGSLNEQNFRFNHFMNFRNRSEFSASLQYLQVNLPFNTDLIGGDEPLLAGLYQFWNFSTRFESDRRKVFRYELGGEYGQFYNGTKTTLRAEIGVRQQPWGTFSINYRQDRVRLPENFGSVDLHLIGARSEISFSNTMFWTTFLQYNTQAGNFNINSRFQWRYQPMSDLFIVYTENYFSDNLSVRNRQLVVKFTYWLNL
ncbi:MAG: DUF5916 domain-containing protein [Bacteroidota bacterium]